MENGKQTSWRTTGDWRLDLALIVGIMLSYFIASRVVKPLELPPTVEPLAIGMITAFGAVILNRLARRLMGSSSDKSGE